MSGEAQIHVEIERITFRNEENGWTVTKVKDLEKGGNHTVTGPFGAISEGQNFHLYGTWTKHPHYGNQFKVERAVPLRPSTKAGVIRYLASGLIKGIGEKTAEKIVAHFGLQTLDVFDSSINRLLEVDSIGKKKLRTIIDAWNQDKAANDVMIFLNTYGISTLFAQKILKTYGQDAIAIVSKDPYRLAADIRGIGFRSADRIAKELGIAPDSTERIRAAIRYHLQLAEDQGHCFLNTDQMCGQLAASLDLDELNLRPILLDSLNLLNETGLIYSDSSTDAEGHTVTAHYRMETFIAETNVAKFVTRLNASPVNVEKTRVLEWLNRFTAVSQIELSEDQLEAVVQSVSSRIFVLTGGPGVGKTTTANTVIRLFKAMGKTVALCAPTGRAAQRLTEVSSTQARTIHRLLEWNPQQGGFVHDETNPLTAQVIIVDEASMLDIHLTDALLRATPASAQIVFIGDVDQLPSVGPGSVLGDLIRSHKISFRKLAKVFRQAEASAIIRTAHQINQGFLPEFDPASDCQFMHVESSEHIRSTIEDLLKNKLPQEGGFNPIRDIQILSPMNRGDIGTQALNDEIQNLLNPKVEGGQQLNRGGLTFRPDDKVIQTVNNYDLGVFNGDIGFVENCNVDGGKLLVRFGDRRIAYENEEILQLRLAYAITIHKSQGSEFPVVLIPVSTQHYIMLQRNLIYTALTRAKKLAIFVGSRKALNMAIQNQTSKKRQSLLYERLKNVVS